MLVTELQQVTKEGNTGDLWESFDLGNIGAIEITKDKVCDRNDGDGKRWDSHGFYGPFEAEIGSQSPSRTSIHVL